MDSDPPLPPDGFYYGNVHNNYSVENETDGNLDHINDLTNSQIHAMYSIIEGNANALIPTNELLLSGFSTESVINPYGNEFITDINLPATLVQPISQTLHGSTSSSSLNGAPPLEPWDGEHNFKVEFNQAQDKTKATPWTYSPKLNKLFVNMDKACPIKFSLNVPPHIFNHYRVRGQLVYSRAEDLNEIVERCNNHQTRDSNGSNSVNKAHVLRCDDDTAYYDTQDRRHSVVINLRPPAPGTQFMQFCFRFMCLSSCIGSLNRRPTMLIFTLEDFNGQAVGRQVVNVRICSCPGRDIKTEEGKAVGDQMQPESNGLIPMTVFTDVKSKGKKRKIEHVQPSPSLSVEDDDKVYFVEVRGRRNYEMIQDIVNRIMQRYNEVANHSQHQSTDNAVEEKRLKDEP